MLVDEQEAVTKAIDAAHQRAKTDVDAALAQLLPHEKTARLSADVHATTQIVLAMLAIAHDAGPSAWETLNDTIILISKRRAQLKQAIIAMVQKASEYAHAQTDEALKLQLINTLRSVSEGKIFVELERVRLTKTLASMQESKGDVAAACKTMQDTQVETLGGMDKREKTDFILEQLRLCLETSDYVRAQITSRKIQTKVFKDPELDDLKIRFYDLIVRFHSHSHNWWEIFQAYRATWDSSAVRADEAQTLLCLKRQVLYLVLSPASNEQVEMTHMLLAEKELLAKLELYKTVLDRFVTHEIFHFDELRGPVAAELDSLDAFDASVRERVLATLGQRVTQHNISVIARYYSRISMERLAALCRLPVDEVEKELCSMYTDKALYARIDRPSGIISFTAKQRPSELLDSWSGNISSLLSLLESTCHLIHKEKMVHAVSK